jgi:hypothetical protein
MGGQISSRNLKLTSRSDGAESPAARASKSTLEPTKWKYVNFESETISLEVGGCEGDLCVNDRSRLHRQGMPCKQARREVSVDGLKAAPT